MTEVSKERANLSMGALMVWRRRSLSVRWLGFGLPGIVFFALVLRGPLADTRWVSPRLFFWLVVVVTVACVVGGIVVMAIGWRRRLAEVAILGSSLTASSALSVVHGLTTPGVLYAANSAIVVSAFVSVPLGVLVASPLIVPGPRVSRTVGVRWRAWSSGSLVLAAALVGALLLRPNLVPAPGVTSPLTYLVVVVSLGGTFALGLRHLRLFRIGRRRASLVASVGFLYLGLSSLVWFSTGPFSIAWWGAHLIDALGIFAAIFGLALGHIRDRSLAQTLSPVVNRDPLVALELGLTPIVHDFIAALDAKDPVTRDHVVRVGELAMRVGIRQGLGPERLRALGLGALLHDVGKLLVPDEILRKPGALSESEFEAIKQHPLTGAELMAGSPLLALAADLVRSHHERADGTGYPDGLRGDQIPLEAGLISVCDGWDAMTYTRHYRVALEPDQARQILREGAGTQWDGRAVELLLEELDRHGQVTTTVFDAVGRSQPRSPADDHVCLDALPDLVKERLARRPSAPALL